MEQKRANEVVAALNAKGVKLPCPRCGGTGFSTVDETSLTIQDKPGTFQLGGKSVPAVMVVCDQCGYLSFHSTIVLGVTKREGK